MKNVNLMNTFVLLQAYCQGVAGRNEPSFGRRKRSLNDTEPAEEMPSHRVNGTLIGEGVKRNSTHDDDDDEDDVDDNSIDFPEHVREMIEVFESREEIENESVPRKLVAAAETLCITPSEYHGLIVAIVLLMLLLFSITLAAGLAYRYVLKDQVHSIQIFKCASFTILTDATGKQC